VVSSHYNLGLKYKKSAVWRFRLLLVLEEVLYHWVEEFIPTLDEGDFVIQPVLKQVLPKNHCYYY
jgi:hypothetical protein